AGRAPPRGRRGEMAAARRGSEPPRLQGRAAEGLGGAEPLMIREGLYALNFYNPMVADQLRNGRKTATIRLGDKTAKYKKGQVVQVLVGARYGAREKIFDAVIDKVEVKALEDLSPREIEH